MGGGGKQFHDFWFTCFFCCVGVFCCWKKCFCFFRWCFLAVFVLHRFLKTVRYIGDHEETLVVLFALKLSSVWCFKNSNGF